jgi:hypothetical protein
MKRDTMKIVLTDEEIRQANAEAADLVKTLPWPVLWAIVAELGHADGLGGHEYQAATERALEYTAKKTA